MDLTAVEQNRIEKTLIETLYREDHPVSLIQKVTQLPEDTINAYIAKHCNKTELTDEEKQRIKTLHIENSLDSAGIARVIGVT